jgi:hypothetical protein
LKMPILPGRQLTSAQQEFETYNAISAQWTTCVPRYDETLLLPISKPKGTPTPPWPGYISHLVSFRASKLPPAGVGLPQLLVVSQWSSYRYIVHTGRLSKVKLTL